MDPDAGLSHLLAQTGQPGRNDRRRRAEVLGHPENDGRIEDIGEARRVSRHEGLEMLKHLLLEDDALSYQVSAVPRQQ
jgi:hypothetical protein